ncbi:hypothetical protein GPALN_005393 [Globodera pallida]|nr:hypothetical protein GPALN_005393 [Globodera pallida]
MLKIVIFVHRILFCLTQSLVYLLYGECNSLTFHSNQCFLVCLHFMPATKKKAQLDPLERHSIVLLWAYNGNDLVLLTFLLDECRFDEYCQANRKNFRVLSLGTWFTIKYQRYVKCETRINVLDVSVLADEPPLRTRVLEALVQLCVPFVCSNANHYTDQYTYSSSLGNIVLRKSQGGGPKKLLIWCSLQTVAWWSDPIVKEVVFVSEEASEIGENGTTKRVEPKRSAQSAGSGLQLNNSQFCKRFFNDIGTLDNDKKCEIDSASDSSVAHCDEDDDSWGKCHGKNVDVDPDFGATDGCHGQDLVVDPDFGVTDGCHGQDLDVDPDFGVTDECHGQDLDVDPDFGVTDECHGQDLDVDPDFGVTDGCHSKDLDVVDPDFGVTDGPTKSKGFAASSEKDDWNEEQTDTKLTEEFEWNHYDSVRAFDWEILTVGVVVERVEQQPSEPKGTVLFYVFPMCTGERYPGVLRLWTRKCLQTGQWVSFSKSWSPFGSLHDGEFRPHPPMFRTLSFLGRVVIECEIVFPAKKGDEITTTWECPQNELSGLSRTSSTPFIRFIEDEREAFGQRLLGTRRWAVLEHVMMEWSKTKSWWKIVYVRPNNFDK